MPVDQDLTLFELRCYRTQPGRRDDLIRMFETHFCPAYEAGGATILASWTVPQNPNLWIWIRAFASGAQRRRALERFYGGAVWRRLAKDCRATIADARTSFLLRPEQAFELGHPPDRADLPQGLCRPWEATVFPATRAAPVAWAEARTLRLASARRRVWLRRAESTLGVAGSRSQGDPPVGPSVHHHWHLNPTACSRLR